MEMSARSACEQYGVEAIILTARFDSFGVAVDGIVIVLFSVFSISLFVANVGLCYNQNKLSQYFAFIRKKTFWGE